MSWINFLGGGVVGGLLVKLLDIVWLQKVISNNERDKWKRDKKFSVYSRLAIDLVSQQEWKHQNRSPELYALMGEAMLLIENETLIRDVNGFYTTTLDSLRRSSGMRQTAEHHGDDALVEEAIAFHATEHDRLKQEARTLVARLRQDMLS